tara:strand:+ start:771 stop:1124 length:354 start_codon:yes stop_codon:yes gene_type:complete
MTLRLPESIGTVSIQNEPMTLSMGQYMNGRLALMLHNKQGEPFAVLSRNIPQLQIDDDEFFLAWYDLTPAIMEDLQACSFLAATGKVAKPDGSHVEIPVWRMMPIVEHDATEVLVEE